MQKIKLFNQIHQGQKVKNSFDEKNLDIRQII